MRRANHVSNSANVSDEFQYYLPHFSYEFQPCNIISAMSINVMMHVFRWSAAFLRRVGQRASAAAKKERKSQKQKKNDEFIII